MLKTGMRSAELHLALTCISCCHTNEHPTSNLDSLTISVDIDLEPFRDSSSAAIGIVERMLEWCFVKHASLVEWPKSVAREGEHFWWCGQIAGVMSTEGYDARNDAMTSIKYSSGNHPAESKS